MTESISGFMEVASVVPTAQPNYSCILTSSEADGQLIDFAVYPQGALVTCPGSSSNIGEPIAYWLQFTPQTTFTVIRHVVPIKNKKKSQGDPIGVKFERAGTESPICLYQTSSPANAMLLVSYLTQYVNRKGFEEEIGIYGKIGKGQSANVYSGFRMATNEHVAVKCLKRKGDPLDNRAMRAIYNQISVLRTLHHPNLMKLLDVFETPSHYALVCELLSGGTLDHIRKTRTLTFLEVREILFSIAQGLRHMHVRGLIHRDLKPENIMIRKPNDLTAVIADFGLATDVSADEYIYVRCGTPGFIAPEIIYHTGRTGQTLISDIFSLGVVAHILGLGFNPFLGRSCHETISKNNAAILKLSSSVYQKANPYLLDFIVCSLERDPSKRLSSNELLNHPLFSYESSLLIKRFESGTATSMASSTTNQQADNDCMQFKPDVIVISDSITILTPEEVDMFQPNIRKRLREELPMVDEENGETPRKQLHKQEPEADGCFSAGL